MHLQLLEASELHRLEEVGSRLRSQRLEAEERKKGSSVKLVDVDQVPPMKRSRGGCMVSHFVCLFKILTWL